MSKTAAIASAAARKPLASAENQRDRGADGGKPKPKPKPKRAAGGRGGAGARRSPSAPRDGDGARSRRRRRSPEPEVPVPPFSQSGDFAVYQDEGDGGTPASTRSSKRLRGDNSPLNYSEQTQAAAGRGRADLPGQAARESGAAYRRRMASLSSPRPEDSPPERGRGPPERSNRRGSTGKNSKAPSSALARQPTVPARSKKGARPAKDRYPWSTEDEARLAAGVQEHGTSEQAWITIWEADDKSRGVTAYRQKWKDMQKKGYKVPAQHNTPETDSENAGEGAAARANRSSDQDVMSEADEPEEESNLQSPTYGGLGCGDDEDGDDMFENDGLVPDQPSDSSPDRQSLSESTVLTIMDRSDASDSSSSPQRRSEALRGSGAFASLAASPIEATDNTGAAANIETSEPSADDGRDTQLAILLADELSSWAEKQETETKSRAVGDKMSSLGQDLRSLLERHQSQQEGSTRALDEAEQSKGEVEQSKDEAVKWVEQLVQHDGAPPPPPSFFGTQEQAISLLSKSVEQDASDRVKECSDKMDACRAALSTQRSDHGDALKMFHSTAKADIATLFDKDSWSEQNEPDATVEALSVQLYKTLQAWQSQDNDVELTQSLAKTLARKGGGFEQLLRDQCAESAAGISAVQEARAALDNAEAEKDAVAGYLNTMVTHSSNDPPPMLGSREQLLSTVIQPFEESAKNKIVTLQAELQAKETRQAALTAEHTAAREKSRDDTAAALSQILGSA